MYMEQRGSTQGESLIFVGNPTVEYELVAILSK